MLDYDCFAFVEVMSSFVQGKQKYRVHLRGTLEKRHSVIFHVVFIIDMKINRGLIK